MCNFVQFCAILCSFVRLQKTFFQDWPCEDLALLRKPTPRHAVEQNKQENRT